MRATWSGSDSLTQTDCLTVDRFVRCKNKTLLQIEKRTLTARAASRHNRASYNINYWKRMAGVFNFFTCIIFGQYFA